MYIYVHDMNFYAYFYLHLHLHLHLHATSCSRVVNKPAVLCMRVQLATSNCNSNVLSLELKAAAEQQSCAEKREKLQVSFELHLAVARRGAGKYTCVSPAFDRRWPWRAGTRWRSTLVCSSTGLSVRVRATRWRNIPVCSSTEEKCWKKTNRIKVRQADKSPRARAKPQYFAA